MIVTRRRGQAIRRLRLRAFGTRPSAEGQGTDRSSVPRDWPELADPSRPLRETGKEIPIISRRVVTFRSDQKRKARVQADTGPVQPGADAGGSGELVVTA